MTSRARALGVEVIHDHPIHGPGGLADVDVVVAADGAASAIRDHYQRDFGTQLRHGRNRYLWLGTSRVFDRFTFAFQPTDAGTLWFHAYPSSADTSTCIVECAEETWRAHGFGERNADDTLRLLKRSFTTTSTGIP